MGSVALFRNDPDIAKEIVESLVPDPALRVTFLDQLAESILLARAHDAALAEDEDRFITAREELLLDRENTHADSV